MHKGLRPLYSCPKDLNLAISSMAPFSFFGFFATPQGTSEKKPLPDFAFTQKLTAASHLTLAVTFDFLSTALRVFKRTQ
jgi:hypothetical protein